MTEDKKAYCKGLVLLAKKSFFSKELFEKLSQHGFDKKECVDAISQLIEQGFIDDEDKLSRLISSYKAKGYGKRKALTLLLEKSGFSRDKVVCRIEALYGGEEEILREWIEKKYGRLITDPSQDREKVRAKMARGSIQRGFSPHLVFSILQKLY